MENPVICISSWLRRAPETRPVAEALVAALKRLGIEYKELPQTNDYWCRDYMPLNILPGTYAKYRYNPDYLQDQPQFITPQEEACRELEFYAPTQTDCIFDGGNYVRCGNKAILTDKIFTENAGYPVIALLHHLRDVFLCEDFVFLPWDMEDPCGHADGMVADLDGRRILLNNYGQMCKGRDKAFHHRVRKILEAHFEVVELAYDCKPDPDSWCYLNFLRLPHALLLPCLSKDATCENDKAALSLFQSLFPSLEIIPIYAYPLVKQGGALHCVTWEYYPSKS